MSDASRMAPPATSVAGRRTMFSLSYRVTTDDHQRCPIPSVRCVPHAAQRPACLQIASAPDVPFCSPQSFSAAALWRVRSARAYRHIWVARAGCGARAFWDGRASARASRAMPVRCGIQGLGGHSADVVVRSWMARTADCRRSGWRPSVNREEG